MFVVTALVWYCADPSEHSAQNAALAGLASGNQNDIAIGLFVTQTLFEPAYTVYIYVGVAMNIVCVVPVGICLVP